LPCGAWICIYFPPEIQCCDVFGEQLI
jgi:hypothetical protein